MRDVVAEGNAYADEVFGRINREEEARGQRPRPNEPDISPEFSDDSLALKFADRHAGDLRFVSAFGKWFCWTGQVWQEDSTLHAFDRARSICREASNACNKAKTSTALASAKTVAAVVQLARADRRIAATIDQWDRDPWLLNTPGGVIDLRTGQVRPHKAEDYFTRIAGIAPDHHCRTPLWQAFLKRITGENESLVSFLKRTAGYALTGITIEHAILFLYGTGANGKSTFLNIIADALGDYHRVTSIETFTASNIDRHPTELASLRGARLVTATETEEGRRWAESRIKALTGGDPISARFMRQDFFEFTPQFKLIIAGNHKPGLRSVDEAIRRRLHLVPFTVTIPPEERDEALSERLRGELPGILAWMVDGCVEWQERSLAPPEAVTAATTKYLEAEDALLGWLEDGTLRNPQAWTTTTALFTAWKVWAERSGEHVGTAKRFSQRLEDAGFQFQRRNTGRGFIGITLPEQETPYWNR